MVEVLHLTTYKKGKEISPKNKRLMYWYLAKCGIGAHLLAAYE